MSLFRGKRRNEPKARAYLFAHEHFNVLPGAAIITCVIETEVQILRALSAHKNAKDSSRATIDGDASVQGRNKEEKSEPEGEREWESGQWSDAIARASEKQYCGST